jgi:hypothetical protein
MKLDLKSLEQNLMHLLAVVIFVFGLQILARSLM